MAKPGAYAKGWEAMQKYVAELEAQNKALKEEIRVLAGSDADQLIRRIENKTAK